MIEIENIYSMRQSARIISGVCVIVIILTFYKYPTLITERYQASESSELSESSLRNFMEDFRRRDAEQVAKLLALDVAGGEVKENEAKTIFYQTLAFPHQGICSILKRIGGKWMSKVMNPNFNMQVDGDKFICMDNIISTKKPCIIYSFGINNEWTFEDQMDSIGCSIYAYDHTIDAPAERGENIKFFKLGLGTEENMDTLGNIIRGNGHTNTEISYLKVDIEGHELRPGGFQDWLRTGALDNVQQLAIELHLPDKDAPNQYIPLLQLLQDMYKLRFRVISQEVNMVMGPRENGFYNFIEVVFMKYFVS